MANKTYRKRSMKMPFSKKKYRKLLTKKRLSKQEKKNLDKALFVQYCKCLKQFKFKRKESLGYPVCMNSIYKKRGKKPPKNASRLCNRIFNKNVDK